MFNIFVLLLFLAVIFYTVYKFFAIKRKKYFEKKVKDYSNLLLKARHSRTQYIIALEKTENFKNRIEHSRKDLTSKKSNLNKIRLQLKGSLSEIHSLSSVDVIARYDKTLINNRKIQFQQNWKVLNDFKISDNQTWKNFTIL